MQERRFAALCCRCSFLFSKAFSSCRLVALPVDDCCKQAMSQACAVSSPSKGILSVIGIFRQSIVSDAANSKAFIDLKVFQT